jgi:hypothetical protein
VALALATANATVVLLAYRTYQVWSVRPWRISFNFLPTELLPIPRYLIAATCALIHTFCHRLDLPVKELIFSLCYFDHSPWWFPRSIS